MELFRRPLGWFLLSLSLLALAITTAYASLETADAYLVVVAYVSMCVAGWTFVVWTVAIGVRVGLAGLRVETTERDRPSAPHYPYGRTRS